MFENWVLPSLEVFLLEFLLPVGLLGLLVLLIRFIVVRAVHRLELEEAAKERVVRTARGIYILVLVVVTFVLGDRILLHKITSSSYQAFGFLLEPFFTSGNTRISLVTVLLLVPLFYFAARIGSWSKDFTEKHLLKKVHMNEGRKFGISSSIKYMIMFLGLLVGLSFLGIDLTSLGLLFSVLGIGLGFGLQNTVENFFAGLVMIFSQPIKEQDLITVANTTGRVIKVRLLSTVIQTWTNDTLIVPNSVLVNAPLHNLSFSDSQIMVLHPVDVKYGTDVEKALGLLKAIALDNPYRAKNRAIVTNLISLGSSGISLELGIWIDDLIYRKDCMTWTFLRILGDFAREGIAIPFPQMDVHLMTTKAEGGR